MAEPTVAVLGTGPDGLGDGRAPGGPGRGGRRLQPDRGAGGSTGRTDRRERWRPRPAEAASRADVVISMVADDAAVRALYDGPDGVTAGLRAGTVAVDMSTVLPDTIRSIAPAVRARGAGVLDAPGLGQRHARPWPASSRSWSVARRPTSSAPGRSSTASRAGSSTSARLGSGAVDEARRQHPHLRAQRRRRRGARPGRAERHRPGRSPTTCSPRARPGAPYRRLQARRRSSTRTRRRSPSRSRSPTRTCGSSASWPRRRVRAMPQARRQSRRRSARPSSRSGEDADFSTVASHLRQEGRR